MKAGAVEFIAAPDLEVALHNSSCHRPFRIIFLSFGGGHGAPPESRDWGRQGGSAGRDVGPAYRALAGPASAALGRQAKPRDTRSRTSQLTSRALALRAAAT